MESSELNRDLIRRANERRLSNLEQELIAATRGPQVELSFADIQKRGLFAVLHEQTRCK